METDHAERRRLEDRAWRRWGTYLAERQWGTIREDYSPHGSCWEYFPHDHARSRAYRWGEDGLFGLCDDEARLCFALALWNGRDPILKERLFGLTAQEGNHGESVKESYFYLDATPTCSYARALYKYPQAEFPYARLVAENRRRGRDQPEYGILDTGALDGGRYFDVSIEYAKASPHDVLVLITATNRGPERAALHLLPTLWFRNTWSWGPAVLGPGARPRIHRAGDTVFAAEHAELGRHLLHTDPAAGAPELCFTENETNMRRVFGADVGPRHAKDAFHDHVIGRRPGALADDGSGTKAAARFVREIAAGGSAAIALRLSREDEPGAGVFGDAFAATIADRAREADAFHAARLEDEPARVRRQAHAGLLWSKQAYSFDVARWLDGDPGQPPPPEARRRGRNHGWRHLRARDVLSMPDKWEYPWFAAWDLAFHMVPLARIDPGFAKEQLLLLLGERYLHPSGQIPAYEFAFSDVNPPVHAWAVWRVYRQDGGRDRRFLSSALHRLSMNFAWWYGRAESRRPGIFSGGFLGLDNAGSFDRGKALPFPGFLAQADGTGWMAFYAATLLTMAIELGEDELATLFLDRLSTITSAANDLLWDEELGFYCDHAVHDDGTITPFRRRSAVGLVPLFAAVAIDEARLERVPGAAAELRRRAPPAVGGRHLITLATQGRLIRALSAVLDERELLSPFGVRSLSRADPLYAPGESVTDDFGVNSNWRGPVWLPLNYLLLDALGRWGSVHGEELRVECPTNSGRPMVLGEVAREIAQRLVRLFLPDAAGRRPCHGGDPRYAEDPGFRRLILFHEYFDAETGRGCGASHQTGWTALVATLLEQLA